MPTTEVAVTASPEAPRLPLIVYREDRGGRLFRSNRKRLWAATVHEFTPREFAVFGVLCIMEQTTAEAIAGRLGMPSRDAEEALHALEAVGLVMKALPKWL